MRRSAICRASSSGRKRPGSSAISRASCSTVLRLLSDDNRPDSCHGSRSRRVMAEITLNGIPSISSPTVANRNLSRSGRNGRKDGRNVTAEALERGQQGPVLGSWSSTSSPPDGGSQGVDQRAICACSASRRNAARPLSGINLQFYNRFQSHNEAGRL